MATKEQRQKAIEDAHKFIEKYPFLGPARRASDYCGKCNYGWIETWGTQNDGHGRQERHLYREKCECVSP